MTVTSKGKGWEWRHSLWILWTFTLSFGSIAFFYIAIRTKQKKWFLWGLFYLVPLVFAKIVEEAPTDSWQVTLLAYLVLGFGIISIIHAFAIRKEYLSRLDVQQRGRVDRGSMFPTQVQTEHGTGVPTAASSTFQAPSSRVGTLETNQGRSSTSPNESPKLTASVTPQASTVDLNKSSEQELATLPGIGIILAKRALSLRETRGGFRSVEDFGQALNLRTDTVERIKPLVSISPVQQSQRHGMPGRVVDF